jgi:hypothetical protein
MKYLNEKEIIVQQLEVLITRGLGLAAFPYGAHVEGTSLLSANQKLISDDSEIARLFVARKVLLGNVDNEGNTTETNIGNTTGASKEVIVNNSFVDEFKKAYDFLVSLRTEKDHGKAILGLIEVGIFLIKIVTALSANEANRNQK